MRTFRVVGSGPLSGRTFYGTVTAVSPKLDCAGVELDEETQLTPGSRCYVFDVESGFLSPGDGWTTDLLRIQREDMDTFRSGISLYLTHY